MAFVCSRAFLCLSKLDLFSLAGIRPRLVLYAAAVLLAPLILAPFSIVQAQTAHVSAVQSVVPTSQVNIPYGVAVDATGNLYVADTYNNRVLKETWSPGGYTESTIGTGINMPAGIAVDESGNVYISTGNAVLKESSERGPECRCPQRLGHSAWHVCLHRNAQHWYGDRSNIGHGARSRQLHAHGILYAFQQH